MVSFFREVNTVEGELDIPVAGIHKGDVQLLCQQLVFLCEIDRFSNQFILKEISPGCSLEGLTLKLKLQYFGHLIQKN